ncbi:hypothetical protein J7J00_17685 [Bacillus sp. ISL-4]|uniref:hypothetical protein n=1 Tax=Bacillus sp. ISL-4 TaxID=2819125 RepID=UPI001BE7C862|nr:hypothetical protein [Bacillus sp. ISL-4]MBT2667314.1 hypothetical protein [Bacillus sp. ISL-4]MBT2674190.1 hypothetical protein [Streptomyces sp. ISL-14]
MKEKYSLNEQTYQFISEYEKGVEVGKLFTIREMVDLFMSSSFYKEQFNTYVKEPNSSMGYAFKRTGNWLLVDRGTFRKK